MRTLKQGGISEDSEFEQEIRRMIVYDDYEKLFNVGGGCWRKTCMLVQKEHLHAAQERHNSPTYN